MTDKTLQDDRTTATPATPETGIAAHNMYRMSGAFVAELALYRLSVDGYRVVHALMHAICRMLPEWHPDIRLDAAPIRSRSLDLRRVLGLEKVNGNRNLAGGMEELAKTDLFDTLHFAHGNEWIVWRFADETLSKALDEASYGLLDASALPSLSSPLDYEVYARTAVVRRMRAPETHLPLPLILGLHGLTGSEWSHVARPLKNALRKTCRHFSLLAVVNCDRSGELRGIDHLDIRFKRHDQPWRPKFLGKVSAATRKCLVIEGTGCVSVDPPDLPGHLESKRQAGARRSP